MKVFEGYVLFFKKKKSYTLVYKYRLALQLGRGKRNLRLQRTQMRTLIGYILLNNNRRSCLELFFPKTLGCNSEKREKKEYIYLPKIRSEVDGDDDDEEKFTVAEPLSLKIENPPSFSYAKSNHHHDGDRHPSN